MDLLGPLLENKQHMLFACFLRHKSNENIYVYGISPSIFISIRSHIMIYKCLHYVIVQVARLCVYIELMSSIYLIDLIDNSFCFVTCKVKYL